VYRVRRHGGTFFAWEPQALEGAAHSGYAEAQPALALELGTEFLQRGIGLLADQLAHQRQGRSVAARSAASGMGPRGNLPSRAPPPPQLLEKRTADAEQGRQGTL
jgi:hypothetical protein